MEQLDNLMSQLNFVRNGGETRRFHTWPVLREQNVAAHSFHVAMLYSVMAGGAEPADGVGLTLPGIMAALTHDLSEWRVGDLPAPAKRDMDRMFPGFRAKWGAMENGLLAEQGLDWEHMLSPRELRWLKLADVMEGCFYCIRERALGNKLIAEPFKNFRSYITQLYKINSEEPVVAAIVSIIDRQWESANV